MNTARDFVVVDVETSVDPAAARVLSVAALTITADGDRDSMYTCSTPALIPARPTSTA